MKIGIDIRCLSESRRTGVAEYTINLLEQIFQKDTQNKYILFLNSWKRSKIDLLWIKKYSNVEIKIFRFPNKFLNLLLWYLQWPKIDLMLGGVDVIFMPNINFIATSKKAKTILTIHDLSFEYFPETFSWKRRLWHFFINTPKLARQVDKIIAVSQSTRDDIIKNYQISPTKIEVIYNGISDNFKIVDRNNPKLLEIKEKYDLPFNFILFLGTFEPRKNIEGLIKAYEKMRKEKNKDLDKYKLVIAGAEGWKSKKIKESIWKSKFKKDIILLNFIDDEDKVYVYSLAALFVYPSFFEGFGLPPLEAMKCGVNVVVSNNSSLPEVVGNGGVLIDADRPDEIAIACKEFLLNNKLHEEFSYNKFRQTQMFNWSKSAKKFLKLINEL